MVFLYFSGCNSALFRANAWVNKLLLLLSTLFFLLLSWSTTFTLDMVWKTVINRPYTEFTKYLHIVLLVTCVSHYNASACTCHKVIEEKQHWSMSIYQGINVDQCCFLQKSTLIDVVFCSNRRWSTLFWLESTSIDVDSAQTTLVRLINVPENSTKLYWSPQQALQPRT